MNDVDGKILEAITGSPGRKAREIADQLGIDRNRVNAALYGPLKGRVRQDRQYRWYLREAPRHEATERQAAKEETLLGKLSKYYLDCLSHDDTGGVSEFAASQYDDLKYAELPVLPMYGTEDPFGSEGTRSFLNRTLHDRNQKIAFLGYPVRLKWIRSRKGWEGFMMEPLLLFPIELREGAHSDPVLTDEPPQLNFKALRGLTNTAEAGLMAEAVQLADELGLANAADEQPELDELLVRLQEIRPDWDWQEQINPTALSSEPPLAGINRAGIFNRCVLVTAERSPYTRGLETELTKLEALRANAYEHTALGEWLAPTSTDVPTVGQLPLLEVLPLNTEQRQAVRQALSNPLTVITGPPGTGKSQVVASILINAAKMGKKVLFASKNNKAVDVVETRVNSLGPRPVLLRLGSRENRAQLAQYLTSLLAATTTTNDEQNYSGCERAYEDLRQRSSALDAQLEKLIELRNEVDAREQGIEALREMIGNDLFRSVRHLDMKSMRADGDRLIAAIKAAHKDSQSLGVRLAWRFLSKRRYAFLAESASAFALEAAQIGLSIPDGPITEATLSQWLSFGDQLSARIENIVAIQIYFGKLDELAAAEPFEAIARQQMMLAEEIGGSSDELWRAWLRLQPFRVSPADRRLIGEFAALLQLIVAADEDDRQLGKDVFSRYYRMFPQLASVLPCWAITSLSARGRLPFEAGFFDILVIDEASQCDIASALPLLYRARQVVIIGDPQQLQHISLLSSTQDQQLLSKYGLLEGFARWSYSATSLFGLASGLCRGEDVVLLRDHHRSHADIIGFSNTEFYDERLRIATRYERLIRPGNKEPAVRWIDVQGTTVRPSSGGAVNEVEAHAVFAEIERLLDSGYRGTLGVVSPFRAQANRITDLVNQNGRLAARLSQADFLSDAVHSFQGDERDVMIFSPALSDQMPRGAMWFLNHHPNLFNVAVTRARAALIVVGDKQAVLRSGCDYLTRFAEYADRISGNGTHSVEVPAVDLGPDFPAVRNPERVSDWERYFYPFLHSRLKPWGICPVPQYPVEKFNLDFAVMNDGRRLDIEIDGERYHRNWDGELCRRDQIRDQRLMELGWDVMRFWVYQVRDDLDVCLQRIDQWIQSPTTGDRIEGRCPIEGGDQF